MVDNNNPNCFHLTAEGIIWHHKDTLIIAKKLQGIIYGKTGLTLGLIDLQYFENTVYKNGTHNFVIDYSSEIKLCIKTDAIVINAPNNEGLLLVLEKLNAKLPKQKRRKKYAQIIFTNKPIPNPKIMKDFKELQELDYSIKCLEQKW